MLTCPACGRANPTAASFCMGCGGLLGATATAHETRKTVTALFCDLVGSTTLGETHDPEVLRGALERYFDIVRAAVERHGGRVEKYVGDAVNGVFGLPAAHEDDALRAVRAGVEIQAGLAGLNATSAVPLAARVGIHTGEVLAPGTGRPLIGDTMNTAARLQSGAEPGSVVIGEPTWRLVRDAVVAAPLEAFALKGKAEPVAAYRVLRVASGSPMRTRRLDAPMVGRAREAALLANAFERVASDRACQLFTVLGTAGAGKSRLVEEFLGVQADGNAAILRGRCLP
jgi:class 3 adenylate cyclase